MKYCVWLTNKQYACAHVEAEGPEEAEEKAKEMYEKRMVDYFEEEMSDISVEEEN